MPTIELHINGKVQGVFYRASTQAKAEDLSLTGWVKNLPDGSVLVRATGPADALIQLEQWCWRGPRQATVVNVMKKELPEEPFDAFRVLRS